MYDGFSEVLTICNVDDFDGERHSCQQSQLAEDHSDELGSDLWGELHNYT